MNVSTISDDRLRRLRDLCLALPEATEKVAWGDPTWRVRDKIFAMQKGNYEGGRPSLWLKASEGGQSVLVEARPEVFFVPPYVGSVALVGIDESRFAVSSSDRLYVIDEGGGIEAVFASRGTSALASDGGKLYVADELGVRQLPWSLGEAP